MDGERDYYAATSGLLPAYEHSLMDHARAAGIDPVDFEYWAALSGLAPVEDYSLADHKRLVIAGGGTPPPATYSELILADAPIGYWRLGEASGTVAADSSGNARDLSYVATPTLGVAGALPRDADTAVDFSGTNYARLAGAAWMNVGVFTVEAWVKTTDAIAQIVNRDDTAANRQWQFALDAGRPRLIVWDSAGTLVSCLGSLSVHTGAWTHIAATCDGTNLRVFINGVQNAVVAQGPARTTLNSPLTLAGNGAASPGETFVGSMDEVAFYDRALSAAELLAHYNKGIEASSPIVGTFIGANGSVADTSSYTFLAEPIGVAGATRRVVVGVCTRNLSGAAQPTSVTIGGIAAARDGTGSDETVWAEAWSAVVPDGATADIVVTLPFTSSGCGIGVWSLDKGAPSGESVGAGGAAVVPLVLTTQVDDFVIAVVHDRVTVLGPSVAFASGTERYDTAFDGPVRQHAGADIVATGASVDLTATIANFGADSAGVAVGFRA